MWQGYFNGSPRQNQIQVLDTIFSKWDEVDIFVVSVPVGGGKSRIAETVAQTAYAKLGKTTSIVVPNNILERQYLQGASPLAPIPFTTLSQFREHRKEATHKETQWWAKKQPIKLLNYYSYLSYRAYSDILIVDECHTLLSWLGGQEDVSLWSHLWGISPWDKKDGLSTPIRNTFDLLVWLEGKPQLEKVKKLLSQEDSDYLIRWETDTYRGTERDVLRLVNITPRNQAPILWPRAVKKIILMSATISSEDIYDLGLDRRRVHYIDTSSPIPAEVRPVIFSPVAKMSYAGDSTEKLSSFLSPLSPKSRGLLHVPYGVASRLEGTLSKNETFLFHTAQNKAARLNFWLRSSDKILVGSGLTEGVDLAYDKCRWQMVGKIAFPSLADPVIRSKMTLRPSWYAWQAIRELLQASGRVCRAPDDYGETYILDAQFARLYSQYQHLFPTWFKESMALPHEIKGEI